MDEAGDGHVLVLQPRRVGLLLALGSEQAIGGGLTVHGDALAHVEAIALLGLHACHFRIVGTTGEGGLRLQLVLVEDAAFFHGLLLLLLTLLALGLFLLRCHCELLRLNLLGGHRDLTIEAEVEAVGEEHVLVVVAIPVLLQHGGYL